MEKKIIISVIVCMLITLVVPMISAADWDNVLSYQDKDGVTDKVAVITNALGLGSEIATIELMTPNPNYVIEGKNRRVMIYDINFNEDYSDALQGVSIKNMNLNFPEYKSYHYEIATYGDVEVPTYKYICEGEIVLKDGSKEPYCENKQVGTHIENKIISWNDFNTNDILKGKQTIALVTDVDTGDYYDGIWTIAGKDLSRHAIWTASLNIGLQAYWKFDEGTGNTASDSLGVYDLTVRNNWTTGIINDALNLSKINHNRSIDTTDFTQFTLNAWTKNDILGVSYPLASTSNTNDINGEWYLLQDSTDAYNSTRLEVYDSVENHNLGAIKFTRGEWFMNTMVLTESNATFYFNGEVRGSAALNSFDFGGGDLSGIVQLFSYTDDTGSSTFIVDELGMWNRTLSDAEVIQLYNEGNGLSYDANPITLLIDLNSPANAITSISSTQIFNCSTNSSGLGATLNLSLYFDNKLNYTIYNTTAIQNLSLQYPVTGISLGNHNWTCNAYDTDGIINWASANRTLTISTWTEESQSYNTTSYETATENFKLNITYDSTHFTSSSATLYYNGTSYTGTSSGSGNNKIFKYQIGALQTGANLGNRTFNWRIGLTNSSGINYFNSSYHNQTVDPLLFTVCNGSVNESAFINLTFIDEDDGAAMNGSIDTSTWYYWLGDGTSNVSLIYSNTSQDFASWGFCFEPRDRVMHESMEMQYSLHGYPQRRWTYGLDLTNTTLNQILYLLSSADGIYVTLNAFDTDGNALTGVDTTVERQYSGVWTTIANDDTDGAGQVTFWLNPDYDHRFTLIKAGCTTSTTIIRPTQSSYSVILDCGTNSSYLPYASVLRGVRYTRTPMSGVTEPGVINFTFSVWSEFTNITNAKLEIVNASSGLIKTSNSTGSCNASCSLYAGYKATNGENLKGRFYVDMNDGSGYVLLEGDAYWRLIASSVNSTGTAKSFFTNFRSLFDDWHEPDEDVTQTNDYSRIVFMFLLMSILIAMFNKVTNVDSAYPGMALYLISFIIIMGSLSGGLTGEGFFYYNHLFDSDIWGTKAALFLNNYILAILVLFISAGYYFSTARRNT